MTTKTRVRGTRWVRWVLAVGIAGAAGYACAEPAEGASPLELKIGGYLQNDGRFFDDGKDLDLADTFIVRRARVQIDGAWGDELSFRIAPEFGESADSKAYDAYIDWNGLPLGSLRIGKFKPPVGLERLQSNDHLLFAERSLVDNLVPNRDVGVAWQTKGRLETAIGVFNQATDRRRENDDVDDGKVVAARVFGTPFASGPLAGLALGVAGTWGRANDAPALSTSQTSGLETVFRYGADTVLDGTEWRVVPQFYWFSGPFGVLGEYAISTVELDNAGTGDEISNHAWQLAGSWLVTGETNGWRGIQPSSPYVAGGAGWGALELVARISEVDQDNDLFPVFADPSVSVSRARAIELGANWYPIKPLKFTLNLARTDFRGGAASGDRDDEKLLLLRAQVAF